MRWDLGGVPVAIYNLPYDCVALSRSSCPTLKNGTLLEGTCITSTGDAPGRCAHPATACNDILRCHRGFIATICADKGAAVRGVDRTTTVDLAFGDLEDGLVHGQLAAVRRCSGFPLELFGDGLKNPGMSRGSASGPGMRSETGMFGAAAVAAFRGAVLPPFSIRAAIYASEVEALSLGLRVTGMGDLLRISL